MQNQAPLNFSAWETEENIMDKKLNLSQEHNKAFLWEIWRTKDLWDLKQSPKTHPYLSSHVSH